MFSRMQVHYSKVLSFETCTADIFIPWKKRDANKTTWPFGHSQISSERAAEHFLEFYRFKFQKTNGSSMYRIHVSYWGHIRNTISYIQLTQLGTISSHFWCLGSPNTANVTPVAPPTWHHPVDMFVSRLHERFEHAILDMRGDSAGNDLWWFHRGACHEKWREYSWNIHQELKMYVLLKVGILQCHVSELRGVLYKQIRTNMKNVNTYPRES